MNYDLVIKLCPNCQSAMLIHRIRNENASMNDYYFYFLHCKECGYGPRKAYNSLEEAICRWNQESKSRGETIL